MGGIEAEIGEKDGDSDGRELFLVFSIAKCEPDWVTHNDNVRSYFHLT